MSLSTKDFSPAQAAILLDLAPVMFVWLDLDGRIRHVNRRFEQVTGTQLDEVRGLEWFDTFVPPGERAGVRGVFELTVTGEETSGTANRIVTHGGRELDVEWQNRVLIGADGRPAGVLAVGVDITERLRAEQAMQEQQRALRQSQAQLAEAEHIAQVGSWTLDLTRNDLVWSDEIYRIFEIDPERFGASYEAFLAAIHPADRGAVDAAFKRSLEAKVPYEIVHRIQMRDGRVKHVRERGRTHYDESGVAVRSVGTVQDVTSEIHAERRLRGILDGVAAFVGVFDLAGNTIEVNRAPLDLAGLSRESIIGKPLADASCWKGSGQTRGKVKEALERAARGEVVRDDFWVRLGDDRSVILDAMFGPLRDEGGQIVSIIGSGIDVTERKRTEEALREADRRKNEFLAMLSHEIRNPLSAICAASRILEKAPPGGAEARRARELIDRQTKHVSRLVDDLLDLTRITRGKITLRRERVELNELLREIAEDHRELFAQHRVQLDVALADQPLHVDGDPARLMQIVGNLLNNAAKFTPPGGRTALVVEAGDADHAVIRVRDDGAGIAPEMLGRVFEPFVQAEQALDRSRGGLGLGLALVKGLVEMHGGSVWAESEGSGKGAQLSVRLPLLTPARPTPAQPEAPRPRGAVRVLVVEDNVDVANAVRDALALSNHEVSVAYSGPEGLEKARATRPDIVFCDIGLPEMDGYEVARAIRADPRLRSTFLVAVSGYCSRGDIDRATEAGFARHLAKPVDIDAMEELISEVARRVSGG